MYKRSVFACPNQKMQTTPSCIKNIHLDALKSILCWLSWKHLVALADTGDLALVKKIALVKDQVSIRGDDSYSLFGSILLLSQMREKSSFGDLIFDAMPTGFSSSLIPIKLKRMLTQLKPKRLVFKTYVFSPELLLDECPRAKTWQDFYPSLESIKLNSLACGLDILPAISHPSLKSLVWKTSNILLRHKIQDAENWANLRSMKSLTRLKINANAQTLPLLELSTSTLSNLLHYEEDVYSSNHSYSLNNLKDEPIILPPLPRNLVKLILPMCRYDPATDATKVLPPSLALLNMRFDSLETISDLIHKLAGCTIIQTRLSSDSLELEIPDECFLAAKLAKKLSPKFLYDTLRHSPKFQGRFASINLRTVYVSNGKIVTLGSNVARFVLKLKTSEDQLRQIVSSTDLTKLVYREETAVNSRFFHDYDKQSKILVPPLVFAPFLRHNWLDIHRPHLSKLVLEFDHLNPLSKNSGLLKLITQQCPQLEYLDLNIYDFGQLETNDLVLPPRLTRLKSIFTLFICTSDMCACLPPTLKVLDTRWIWKNRDCFLPPHLEKFVFGKITDDVLFSLLKNRSLVPIELGQSKDGKLLFSGKFASSQAHHNPISIIQTSVNYLRSKLTTFVLGFDEILAQLQRYKFGDEWVEKHTPNEAPSFNNLALTYLPDETTHLALPSLHCQDIRTTNVTHLELRTRQFAARSCVLPPSLTHLTCNTSFFKAHSECANRPFDHILSLELYSLVDRPDDINVSMLPPNLKRLKISYFGLPKIKPSSSSLLVPPLEELILAYSFDYDKLSEVAQNFSSTLRQITIDGPENQLVFIGDHKTNISEHLFIPENVLVVTWKVIFDTILKEYPMLNIIKGKFDLYFSPRIDIIIPNSVKSVCLNDDAPHNLSIGLSFHPESRLEIFECDYILFLKNITTPLPTTLTRFSTNEETTLGVVSSKKSVKRDFHESSIINFLPSSLQVLDAPKAWFGNYKKVNLSLKLPNLKTINMKHVYLQDNQWYFDPSIPITSTKDE